MTSGRQFAAANRMVDETVVTIEQVVAGLLGATRPLEGVALDYVIERLVETLIERNPRALDYLNHQNGEGSMQLANALMDWRDQWEKR